MPEGGGGYKWLVVVIRPVKDSAVLRLWWKSAPDSSPGIGGRYTPWINRLLREGLKTPPMDFFLVF